jgi:hypothetical protein
VGFQESKQKGDMSRYLSRWQEGPSRGMLKGHLVEVDHKELEEHSGHKQHSGVEGMLVESSVGMQREGDLIPS